MEGRSCLYLNVYAPYEVGIVWRADRAGTLMCMLLMR